MSTARVTAVRSLPTTGSLPHHEVMCAWCGQDVGRKPLSGARLSHTICRPCVAKFCAEEYFASDIRLD